MNVDRIASQGIGRERPKQRFLPKCHSDMTTGLRREMAAALFHQDYHRIALVIAIVDFAVAIANIHCHHLVVQHWVVDWVGVVVLVDAEGL
jgi:hypothetical protein